MIDEQEDSFYLSDDIIKEIQQLQKEIDVINYSLTKAFSVIDRLVKAIEVISAETSKINNSSPVNSKGNSSAQSTNNNSTATSENPPMCPACGKVMKKRSSVHGEFWGCTGYPTCKRTYNIPNSQSSHSSPNTKNLPWNHREFAEIKEALKEKQRLEKKKEQEELDSDVPFKNNGKITIEEEKW